MKTLIIIVLAVILGIGGIYLLAKCIIDIIVDISITVTKKLLDIMYEGIENEEKKKEEK